MPGARRLTSCVPTAPASSSRASSETGGRAALPMWIDYMRVVLDGVPEKPLLPPPGIVTTHGARSM